MPSKSNHPVRFGRILLRNCVISLSIILSLVVWPTQADHRIQALINHRGNADPGRYAYMVALYHDSSFLCGGTLIAPDIVLTAAQCINFPIGPFFASIRTRPYRLQNPVAESERFRLEWTIIHPEYDPSLYRNDVAIVKLSGASNNQVLSVLNEDASVPVVGQSMTVVGWGQTTNDSSFHFSNKLQELSPVTYIDNETCQKLDEEAPYLLSFNFDIRDGFMCTLDPEGQGACNGDEGEVQGRR